MELTNSKCKIVEHHHKWIDSVKKELPIGTIVKVHQYDDNFYCCTFNDNKYWIQQECLKFVSSL